MTDSSLLDCVVIGAGQAGLSTSYHLTRMGLSHVVLDANDHPGGAWSHRWDSLTMLDVHRVADLPGLERDESRDASVRANEEVPRYFDEYERHFDLPVERPVAVDLVSDDGGVLVVQSGDRTWRARTLVNATGTWSQPFVPHYPGASSFAGRQFHTVNYPGPDAFTGQRVVVVGGGASAVQFLGEIAPIAWTIWVTRREPVWSDAEFTPEIGRAVVAKVEERVRQGLPPASVVSVTGLRLRPQEQRAATLGAYERHPMFDRITATGVEWLDGGRIVREEPADAILWATGFRPAIAHLAPLTLRSPRGGIQLDGTTAVVDPRIQLVGYGPSASTIGANRAGRTAARGVAAALDR